MLGLYPACYAKINTPYLADECTHHLFIQLPYVCSYCSTTASRNPCSSKFDISKYLCLHLDAPNFTLHILIRSSVCVFHNVFHPLIPPLEFSIPPEFTISQNQSQTPALHTAGRETVTLNANTCQITIAIRSMRSLMTSFQWVDAKQDVWRDSIIRFSVWNE